MEQKNVQEIWTTGILCSINDRTISELSPLGPINIGWDFFGYGCLRVLARYGAVILIDQLCSFSAISISLDWFTRDISFTFHRVDGERVSCFRGPVDFR